MRTRPFGRSTHPRTASNRTSSTGSQMLSDLLNVAVIVFAITSMLSVGLSYPLRRILAPLRNLRLVVISLLANFVIVPAWALLITWLLHLDEPFRVGILLAS